MRLQNAMRLHEAVHDKLRAIAKRREVASGGCTVLTPAVAKFSKAAC